MNHEHELHIEKPIILPSFGNLMPGTPRSLTNLLFPMCYMVTCLSGALL